MQEPLALRVVAVVTTCAAAADLLDGRVPDQPDRPVRLHQAVRTLDVSVAVAGLVLALHVVRAQVLDAVDSKRLSNYRLSKV